MAEIWENLRKQARTLENAIDSKLVSINKLNSTNGAGGELTDKSVSSRQSLFSSLETDIETLLAQLGTLNDQMCDLVTKHTGSGWSSNPAVQHTLRRHRDILRDYGIEFTRARTNIRSQLDRESLLSGGNSTKSVGDGVCLNNRAKMNDFYLKENEHINSCDRLLDEQMSMAMATKENLHRQRTTLGGVSRRMQQIVKKYPMLNSVMQKIQSRKRRDTVIMAGVISTCLIFMFIYAMH